MSLIEMLDVSFFTAFVAFFMISFSTMLFIGDSEHPILNNQKYLRRGLGLILLGAALLLLFGNSRITISINGTPNVSLDFLIQSSIRLLLVIGLAIASTILIILVRKKPESTDCDDFTFNEQLLDDGLLQSPATETSSGCLLLFDKGLKKNDHYL